MRLPELVFTQSVGEALRKYCSLNGISNAIILCDSNTRKFCLPILGESSFPIIEIPVGEENKNLKTLSSILDGLIALQANRFSTLINLGGGVVCDIGGFAASVYMRGIPYINIPTTVLAMADAAIGGKTGIDHNHLKNLAGTFSLPELIIVSDEFVATQEKDEVKSAYAEIVKTACICNPELFHSLKNKEPEMDIIMQCASTKYKLTGEDLKDRNKRQLLNFGHTIGHALESYRLEIQKPLKHGFAVAKGILMELDIATHLGILSRSLNIEMKELLIQVTGVDVIEDSEFEGLFRYLPMDKKNHSDSITFSLPLEIGKGDYGIKVKAEELKNWKKQGFI